MTLGQDEMAVDSIRLDALMSEWNLSALKPLAGLAEDQVPIASGQMWRARWDDAVAMVFIDSFVGGLQNLVRVAPVTIGADLADDGAIVLPSEFTSLSVELSVWPELVTNLAEVVLEQWIADVETFSSIEQIERAASEGELHRGLPVLNVDGRRAKEKRMLALVVEVLANATRVISGTGQLPDMIAAAGLTVTVLARTIHEANSVALGIAKGSLRITLPQARLLAPTLDSEPIELLQANPEVDGGLVMAITRLSVSSPLRQLAALDRISETDAFEALTRGAMALAARSEGAESAWDARVNLYFHLRLGDGKQ
jgi:hypothetical protein